MCEVTWNTWRTYERSWCQCMSLHALKILRFPRLFFLFSVCVVVLLLSSLIDARTLLGSRLSLCLHSSHSHPHVSYLFISLIFLLFLLPVNFIFQDVVDNKPAHFRWGAGPPGQKELLHTIFEHDKKFPRDTVIIPHYLPEGALQELRRRLRAGAVLWPTYPEGMGFFLG